MLSFSYIASKNVVYYYVALEVLVERAICIHVQSCVFIFFPSPPPTHYEIAHIYRPTLSDTGLYKEIIIDLTLPVYIPHATNAKVKFSNSGNTLFVKFPTAGHKWWSNGRGLPGVCWSFECKPDSTSRLSISCINLSTLRSFIFIAQFVLHFVAYGLLIDDWLLIDVIDE